MRKKTEFGEVQDGDSFFKTASKIINSMFGSQETDYLDPQYNINTIRGYPDVYPGIPVKHIHKRDVSTGDMIKNNGYDFKDNIRWTPIFITRNNESNSEQTVSNICSKKL